MLASIEDLDPDSQHRGPLEEVCDDLAETVRKFEEVVNG